jgi:hypothetical protein
VQGRRIGRFVVERALGAGGMGAVYAARDEVLDRLVALKVLPSAHEDDPERRTRLLREARSAAALSHANVATVYEAGEGEGIVFLAMELVTGACVRTSAGARALDPQRARRADRGRTQRRCRNARESSRHGRRAPLGARHPGEHHGAQRPRPHGRPRLVPRARSIACLTARGVPDGPGSLLRLQVPENTGRLGHTVHA